MDGSKHPIGYSVRCTAEGNTDAGLRFNSFLISKTNEDCGVTPRYINPKEPS
jgi:hypothetical protein